MGDVDQSKEEFVAHSLASASRRIHPWFEDAGFDSNKASMLCLYHEPGISFGTSYLILPEGRGHWIQRLRPGQTKSGTGLKQRGPRICPHLPSNPRKSNCQLTLHSPPVGCYPQHSVSIRNGVPFNRELQYGHLPPNFCFHWNLWWFTFKHFSKAVVLLSLWCINIHWKVRR